MTCHYNPSIKADDSKKKLGSQIMVLTYQRCLRIYCCPSIPIKVSVDLIFGIFLIFQVIVSLSASTWPDSTFARMSYAPKVPCTSITPSINFSSEITASSEPSPQFIRTYAVASYDSTPYLKCTLEIYKNSPDCLCRIIRLCIALKYHTTYLPSLGGTILSSCLP